MSSAPPPVVLAPRLTDSQARETDSRAREYQPE